MVDYKRVPFDRALASLADRVPLPTKSWTEHMGDAQNWAFTVSGITKASLLLQIQARTTQAIANGDSFEDFQVDFQKLMVKAGMAPLAPWRMRLVMLQNMRHSYNAGRYREQTDPETMQRRPWAVYRHDHPITPRLHHLALHGFTARISDPIWQIIYPPGGFNCFPAGTLVNTPGCQRQIQTLIPGDLVCGGSGNVQPIRSIHKNQFTGQLRRISVESGASFASTPNHRILTTRGWIDAASLVLGDELIEIPQSVAEDVSIGNINQSNTLIRDRLMSLPLDRQTTSTKAFNAQLQRWDIDVDPIMRHIVIVDNLQAHICQMIHHLGFSFSRLHSIIDMLRRICKISFSIRCRNLGLHLWSTCRRRVAQFLSSYSDIFGISFSDTKARRRMVAFDVLLEKFSRSLAAILGVDPLGFNRLATVTNGDIISFKQSTYGSIVHGPSITQLTNSHHLTYVETIEDFSDGAPLNGFDTLDSFCTWARSHCRLSRINSLSYINFSGYVYNLTVEKDNTFCIPFIVHNCRCSIRTYSEDQLEDAGFSPSPPLAKDATGIPLVTVDGQQRRAVDKGFEFAPGANDLVHRSRILADAMRRMPPELRQEFMKALGDRIPRPGQPVPDVPVPAPDRKTPKPPAPPKSEIPTTRRTAPADPTIERMRELLKLKSDVSTDEILEKALKRLKWRNLYDEPPQWVDVEKVRADVIKNGRRDIVPQRVERVKQLILKSLESGDEIPIIELGLWLDRGYEMSDGNHRLEAFYQLGFKQILANVDAEVNPDAPPSAPARPRGRRSSQKPVRPTVQELFSDLPRDAETSLFKQELIQAHEEFTRWESSWENSPAWVKAVISRIEPAGHLAPMEDNNGAFLRRSRIHMNGFTPDKIAAPEVWRHEYGHYIDRMLGIRRAAAKGQVFEDRQWSFISSKDRRFDTSFKRDSGRLIAMKAKANQERFNEVNKYLMGRQGRDGMVDRKLLEDLGFDVTDLPDRVVPFNVLIEQPDAKVKLAHEITYLLDRRKINGDAIARRAPKVWQTIYEQTKAAVKAKAPKMDTAKLNRFLAAMAVQDVEFLVEHLFDLTKRWAMDPMDLVGSITRNKVSTGHSDEYYRIDGMDRTETFANIIGLLGQPEIGEDLVKYLSPENYKVVKKIFEEFTKSGDVMFDSYGDDVNDNPPKVFSDD